MASKLRGKGKTKKGPTDDSVVAPRAPIVRLSNEEELQQIYNRLEALGLIENEEFSERRTYSMAHRFDRLEVNAREDFECESYVERYLLHEDVAIENMRREHQARVEMRAVRKQTTVEHKQNYNCLLYTSPSPRDGLLSRMPSSA